MVAGLLGWTGTAGTFGAYVMVSRGRLSASSRIYAWLNIVGGVMCGIAAVVYGAWPSAASNFVWAAFALGTVASMEWKARAERRPQLALCPDEPADDSFVDRPLLEACA